jgi:hypothetical protein
MNRARCCGRNQAEACGAVQSTNYLTDMQSPWSAEKAVDGIKAGPSNSHTDCSESNPWWMLDLGSSKEIAGGKIWGVSIYSWRTWATLDGFQIWIGDSQPYNSSNNVNCYTARTYEHAAYPYTHTFPCFVIARYIFVTIPRQDCLVIKEVEIYPPNCKKCSAGSYSALTGITFQSPPKFPNWLNS